MSNTQFAPGAACFLLTQAAHIMPATFAGYDQRGLAMVKAPGGRIYSCNPVNVLDLQQGGAMLAHGRAEKMPQEGYQIAVRIDQLSFRVYQPKKHGQAGGWVVSRTGESLACNCPAHADAQTCKHVLVVCSLLRLRADRLREVGKIRVATRYSNLAGVIHQAA